MLNKAVETEVQRLEDLPDPKPATPRPAAATGDELKAILAQLLDVIDSGYAPAYSELSPSVDLTDEYYCKLYDILDANRGLIE